ncbi:FUSC family protein [Alkalimarinus sediminis]|uniref:FUSC family protein n=1 Tax=Alkalimarinus sediminis TaxID=1632866 RepID=A0A9E8HGL2_9ALTE|nr:FUSC family protein [Alkalimarinus sediminis]UZW74295.1 FUSC family protein [Alkalimarinus sediminis]
MSEKALDDIKNPVSPPTAQSPQPSPSFKQWLSFNQWLWPFCLSEKFKFASKVALSLTLAFLIPMAMGWPQASTAATTVMLIASISSQCESLAKGTFRVIGTIIGAVIGLLLVGLFAQDRLQYMLAVSIIVAIVFYIRNAYTKDPTLFMLTGVMVLMMSNGGDADGAFIYGIDRAFMTTFGVVIYTLVGVFVFPTKAEQNLTQLANELSTLQLKMFERITAQDNYKDENDTVLIQQLYGAQDALEKRYELLRSEHTELAAYKKEWDLALHYYKQLTQLLVSVAQSSDEEDLDRSLLINDYHRTISQIQALFESTQTAWHSTGNEPMLTREHDVAFNEEALKRRSHLQRGSIIAFGYFLNSLQQKLPNLIETIRCIDSVTGRITFKEPQPKQSGMFLWWDAENAKTAIKVFVGYWIAGLFWIYFNPPGGYSFVIFSTIFISLLSFLPIHPVMLLVLFTFGFLFAVPSYVFILPQLTLGIELGIFIFIYTFIAFYLFKGPITIFFLLGLFILGIDNTMNYHFGIILTIMLLFYLVVLMIIISYYVPFSSKPEHLFSTMRERFFRHAAGVMRFSQFTRPTNAKFNLTQLNLVQLNLVQLRYRWHIKTMSVTVNKLKLWGAKTNHQYFGLPSAEPLNAFAEACNLLSHQLTTFELAEQKLRNNRLVAHASEAYSKNDSSQAAIMLIEALASGKEAESISKLYSAYYNNYQDTENKLEHFFKNVDLERCSHKEISGFYILLHLKKNIFDAINQCKATYEDVNWASLRQNRF